MPAAVCCGIDPGREKFGLALVGVEKKNLLLSAILPMEYFELTVNNLIGGNPSAIKAGIIEGNDRDMAPVERFFLGDGTSSQFYVKILERGKFKYNMVDEKNSTLAARGLYWKLHPPSGLWRLVPLSLRVPPRPIDDLAAWEIALRALNSDVTSNLTY